MISLFDFCLSGVGVALGGLSIFHLFPLLSSLMMLLNSRYYSFNASSLSKHRRALPYIVPSLPYHYFLESF